MAYLSKIFRQPKLGDDTMKKSILLSILFLAGSAIAIAGSCPEGETWQCLNENTTCVQVEKCDQEDGDGNCLRYSYTEECTTDCTLWGCE